MKETKHQFAFCHVSYQNLVDPSDVISVWNSRDGEIPLKLQKKGQEYHQITLEPNPDPDYKPKSGDFIFRDFKGHELENLIKIQTRAAEKQMIGGKRSTKAGRSKYKRMIRNKLKGNAVLIKLGEKKNGDI